MPAERAIIHLNEKPTPKQRGLFEEITKLKFPKVLITTRQGANLAIKALMQARADGVGQNKIASTILSRDCFAKRFAEDLTVAEFSVVVTMDVTVSFACATPFTVDVQPKVSLAAKLSEAMLGPEAPREPAKPVDKYGPQFQEILTVDRGRRLLQ